MSGIKACIDRYLPEELVEKAYRSAIQENPDNEPDLAGLSDRELALCSGKKWKNGRTLKVRFMDGAPDVQAKVEACSHVWSKYANIKFDFGEREDAEIRISFMEEGSWSYLGTDALPIPRDEPTMNFGWLHSGSPDEEYERVVAHEFGHALGCIHEHQNPTANIPWNEDEVYKYYTGPPNNWPEQQVLNKLLNKYSQTETQFAEFDPESIMLYPIPKEHTTGGYEVGWNHALSEQDKKFIWETYPLTPEQVAEAIEAAVSELDKVRTKELCDLLVASLPTRDDPFPLPSAKSILSSLRRKRCFALMQQVADAFLSNGQRHAQIRRQYGQALIDSGQLHAALAVLEAIVADPDAPPSEVDEAWGLIGRAYKQSYVNHTDATEEKKQQMMAAAIKSYERVYGSNPDENLWHGINVVALLARADRDGIPAPIVADFREIAGHIRDTIEEREREGKATLWDYGTAMEAAVALGDAESAANWAEKYVDQGPDAFELASTLRQLEEVWNVSEQDEAGQAIVPLLKAALLAAAHGSISFPTSDFAEFQRRVKDTRLERVFGDESYKQIKWLRLALHSCRSIALIAKQDGKGVGTGFAVNGRSLSPSLEDDWYFLTSSHVITDDEAVIEHSPPGRRPLRPEQAVITFEILFEQERTEFGAREVVWTSPPHGLDVTLLRLDPPFHGRGVKAYQIAPGLPDLQDKPRVYIAGHAGGGRLTISLYHNRLVDYNDWLMQYRTLTAPGSSGSPVFNDQWELVGLHRSGSSENESLSDPSRELEANEGTRISAIMDAIG